MVGRKKDGELSQTPRAIKRRAATAAKKAGAPAAAGPGPADPGVSTEKIGVDAPVKKKAAAPVQAYHCLNCDSPVSQDDPRCPTCEIRLEWGG